MGSTFLELTNKLLVRINEVPLTDTNFSSARNLQAVCKDAIADSVREINQQRWEWPFAAVEHTQELAIGESEYGWPTDFKSVDWESFQIQGDEALEVRNTNLIPIDKDEWYKFFKDQDDESKPNGAGVPKMVFKTHGTGFGVTPNPDKEYMIKFRYYKNLNELSLWDDTTDIPSVWNNVILAGALAHVNLFKENPEGFNIADGQFKKGITQMYNNLVGSIEHAYDSRSMYAQTPVLTKSGNYKL